MLSAQISCFSEIGKNGTNERALHWNWMHKVIKFGKIVQQITCPLSCHGSRAHWHISVIPPWEVNIYLSQPLLPIWTSAAKTTSIKLIHDCQWKAENSPNSILYPIHPSDALGTVLLDYEPIFSHTISWRQSIFKQMDPLKTIFQRTTPVSRKLM